MPTHFEYPPEACDVKDMKSLLEHRRKLVVWSNWLRDDEHSVQQQLSAMLWSDAVFRAINEARRFGTGDSPTAAGNGTLAEFIDHGYVATQVLSIRKLTEQFDRRHPKRGVISLPRIIEDLRRHQSLFTRENYVAHDGLPYDYESIEQENLEERLGRAGSGGSVEWVATKGPRASGTSQRLHEEFDRLAGTSSIKRSRLDVVNPIVFDTLLALVQNSGAEKIVTFGNKYVAHAADNISRASASIGQFGLTFNQMSECQRALARVARMISEKLLWDAAVVGLVPVPQFDQFENLDKPFVPSERMDELHTWWQQHTCVVDRWAYDELDDLGDAVARIMS